MLDVRRAILAAVVLVAGTGSARADRASPAVLLEEAFYREVAAHDPQAAAVVYAQVLATPHLSPALAARARLPAIWGQQQFVDAGGRMSYAPDF